jgi:MFS superfamily sulfate permease-like transporter
MKFTRKRVERYGLQSQKLISQMESKKLLKENGIVVNGNNKNCLFMHNKRESIKHFIVKAILFKILRELDRSVGSEIEIRNGIVDIIDLDNLIVYEIENGMNKKNIKEKIRNYRIVKDIFFIDCKRVPENLEDAEKYLRRVVI